MFDRNTTKTIYIIDGYAFIFRAFYAVPNLTSKTGEPIGAVFGFFKMLISLINTERPDYIVVALDTGKRTFRNDIYDNFIENKSINELYSCQNCKEHFDKFNISLEEIKNLSSTELIDRLNIDKDKVIKICEEFNVDFINPPKVLVLLLFLEMGDNIKVEDYKTQYKANRRETPAELKSQFKIVKELIDAMNIKTESVIGYEADDVIASIATEAVDKGYKAVIVTGDKDLCQLVKDDKISVFDPSKKKVLDEQGVIERFGVKSNQVCDYLSIVGDHSDNVFGVNGIGPKGAIKLLEKYGNIENILLHLNELDDKTRQKFIDSKEVLELAHKLISLKYDALQIDNFEKYLFKLDEQGLRNFREKYGFKDIDSNLNHSGFRRKNNNSEKKETENTLDFDDKKDEIENDNKKNDGKKIENKNLFQGSLF